MNGWIILITYVVLNATYSLEWATQQFSNSDHFFVGILESLLTSRGLATIITIVFSLLALKPVWRNIWAIKWIGETLSEKIYPDLNGEWEFTLKSNWPIVSSLRTQTKEDDGLDHTGGTEQNLKESTFIAVIEQSWLNTKVTVKPNSDSRLRQSRTISVELLKENLTGDKLISWTFLQQNSLSLLGVDSKEFFGSAVLTLDEDFKSMQGQYWTSSSWEKGLNTAGVISAKQLKK